MGALGSGVAAGGGAAPSFSLTCILTQSLCVFFDSALCIYPSLCMFCLHMIYVCNSVNVLHILICTTIQSRLIVFFFKT